MTIGMLWFSNDKDAKLKERVMRGVEYYENKYFKKPDRVHIHPDDMEEGLEIKGVTVVEDKDMLPNYFWIGVADAESKDRP